MTAQQSIAIEQALHGYSRGHKELAISSPLDPRSRAAMLSYSDLLITAGSNSPPSYLCAYPLKAAQRFVFARTWLGGDGLRPGSVWTHSLILDFPALTLIDDLAALSDLFELPRAADFSPYQRRIEFHPSLSPDHGEAWQELGDRAQIALRQLYGATAQPIVMLAPDGRYDELLAVALWRQMWPALRRNFAFLTGPTIRAPKFDAECSLHFLSRRAEELVAEAADGQDAGYLALARDLQHPGPTDLRAFIGRYAIESERPRKLVPALAQLHDLEKLGPLAARVEKIRALQDGWDLPRLVRDTIVGGLSQAPREADLLTLVEEYRNQPAPKNLSDAIAPLSTREDVSIARLLSATQPSGDGELGKLIFDTVAGNAPLEALVDAADQGIRRIKLLGARNELWGEPGFWPKADEARAALVREAGRPLGIAAILALFDSDIGPEVARLALQDPKAEPGEALLLLDQVGAQTRELVADSVISNFKWIETFGIQPEMVSAPQLKLLCDAIIRRGERPFAPEAWIALVVTQIRRDTGALDNALLAVGFMAALGIPPQRALPVAKLVYDPLIRAVRGNQLSREQERFLAACLPSARSNALRYVLASAVVDKWHTTDVNTQALSITSDSEALKDIVDFLMIRFGRDKLEIALGSKSLAPATLAQVAKVYQPKPRKTKKSTLWWWDW